MQSPKSPTESIGGAMSPLMFSTELQAPYPEPPKPRTMICCFDGTGNRFGENSNVVRLFGALERDKPNEQIVYYQPGIGTYNRHHYHMRTLTYLSSALDQAIAFDLDDHVKQGYQFIMQNYRPGDKICLFGFSRGAYTARVVMGMIYKIGLLPRDNMQQIDFAFSVYQMTGEEGRNLSREFKRTFALPVTVEFVGVWDTVSSVGIIPKVHHYTSVNYAVKTFRHALALDECRARFRPKAWHEPTLEREQELDVDEPDLPSRPGGKVCRDEWEYTPPKRIIADVEEVWFAGCHADVGGGSHHNRYKNSLSFIPLRWMVKEAIIAETGILFNYDRLADFGFDFVQLAHELNELGHDLKKYNLSPNLLESVTLNSGQKTSLSSPSKPAGTLRSSSSSDTLVGSPGASHFFKSPVAWLEKHRQRFSLALKHAKDAIDTLARTYDQLEIAKGWWMLEYIPMLVTYQATPGHWARRRVLNLGSGRYIPFYNDKVLVHESVQEKCKNDNYFPAASNWKHLVEADLIEYTA